VFGILSLGALAALGQDYVNPAASLSTLVTIFFFVIQIVLNSLWLVRSAIDQPINFTLSGHQAHTVVNTASPSEPQRTRKLKKPAVTLAGPVEMPDSHLTAKELEVLQRVVAGKKNKEIADELQISEASVKVHKSRMTSKLGVKTLPELARALQVFSGREGALPVSQFEESQSILKSEEVKKD
jgi:DNA-binding CsgD family transcriptional regulator